MRCPRYCIAWTSATSAHSYTLSPSFAFPHAHTHTPHDAALAVLSSLRPDVHEVLEVAAEGGRAVQAAQQLVYQVSGMRGGLTHL